MTAAATTAPAAASAGPPAATAATALPVTEARRTAPTLAAADASRPAGAEVAASRIGRAARRLARRVAIRSLVPALLVAAWCAVSYGGLVRAIYLPTPSALWSAFVDMRAALPGALVTSVGMTLTGYGLGLVLGVGMGLVFAYSRMLRDLFGGVLDFIRPAPVFALIPLFLLWFGIGRGPQIALITMGTSVVLSVTTLDAVRNVSPTHIRAAATMGASRRAIYRTIVVPSIFPHLLGAVRFSAVAAWGLDVAAELIGSQNGLGYLMMTREQYIDTAGILVVVVLYGLLATVLDRVIVLVERPLTGWTTREQQSAAADAAFRGN
ncbi:ABC transporter permease [Pseudofrankia saprophytica]|uniref:ABC transporter permease n=1 Tax=Pseudofrankia saprophytica TaxID=298655 RepID=UPI0002E4E6BA|nr:ABC transporter permease [Pseudofrankia saprophytica]